MRFCVDHDLGHSVGGWVVPDNPVAISRVAVVIEGERVGEVSALESDNAIRAAGWHSTGQCRFMIEEAEFPGLTGARRLEVFDVETNVLVYRRAPHDHVIQKKFVLVNTSIHPETVIQAAMFDHFQQSYFGIGTFNEEVARVIFEAPWLTSSFQSGAIILPNYEGCLQSETILTALLVHDPFIEMANRLIWLQEQALIAADPRQRWRLGTLVEAANFLSEVNFGNIKHVRRLLSALPEQAYQLIYNPLTRQCGTKMPGDRLLPGHSINAIEVLARVGVVGHRNFFESFVATLFDRLGIQGAVPSAEPVPETVSSLANNLRTIKIAQELLVFDIALSDAVTNAVSKAWASS